MTAPSREEQHRRLCAHQCIDCGLKRHSAGRTRCEDCHHAYIARQAGI